MRRTDRPRRFRFGVEARSRRARWKAGLVAGAVAILLAAGAVAQPAYAASYPSWQDVQNAKANAATAAAQVANLNALIAQVKVDVATTAAAATKRGAELEVAQEKFDSADQVATALAAQAAKSRSEADAAIAQAGRLASQLYRTGGNNITANLLLSANGSADARSASARGAATSKGAATSRGTGTSPERLLANLGSMSKLVEHSSTIYAQAKTAQNNARSLSAQAKVAKAARAKLQAAAQAALQAAAAAATAAQAKLATEQTQVVVMQAQLAALQNTSATTVAAYEAGVAAQAKAAGASGGAGLPGGFVGAQGWAVPVHGTITDGFGPRVSPCSDCSNFHRGIDLGAACGTTIYAAHDGTVIYAGPDGTYGNFVLLDNGASVSTGYAHIRPGGIFVGIGQQVSAGEPIASVGTTGASTGCHLHFEVRINGVAIDGIPFMRQRGAPLG